MKKFICTICGYVYEGDKAPDECPVCRQPGEKFKEEVLEDSMDSQKPGSRQQPVVQGIKTGI